jgi:PhoPQ-activated pathogenicity-related protein
MARQLLKSIETTDPDCPNILQFQRTLLLKEMDTRMHKLIESDHVEPSKVCNLEGTRKMQLKRHPISIFCLAWACVWWASGDARSEEFPEGLKNYVARPEPVFRWEMKGKSSVGTTTVFDLHLVSQNWQGIVWEHALQVYQPANAKPAESILLWNQGGQPSAGSIAFGIDLAGKIGSPVAFLYGIPNQPLLGNRKEDALIAETFVRYLETKDERWPLLFPMVKSLVKAMDALQAFSEQEWKSPLRKFIVTGASKRGWTTWLTAASDSRVMAIAPMVIDTLKMQEQGPYQLKSFGHYSEQIKDYTERNLVPMPDTPEARRLWTMVDPWAYRDRIRVPKLLINGANDQYWTTDALNLYWEDLLGDKWVIYVPNAGHNLEQRDEKGGRDRSRAVNTLAAFAKHQFQSRPFPELSWRHGDADNQARLEIQSKPAPQAARVWVANAPTRDFRLAKWAEQSITVGKSMTAVVAFPDSGYRVFFAELEFEIDGLPFYLSTQMRILGAPAQ